MKKILAFFCLFSMLLGGCGISADVGGAGERAGEVLEDLTQAAQEISEGDALETEAVEDDAATFPATDTKEEMPEEEGGATEETAGAVFDASDFSACSYYDTQLSGEERKIYDRILEALLTFESDVHVDPMEEEAFDKVFQCVMNDHPEIFYVDGYTFIKYTKGEELTGNAFSGSYIYDRDEVLARKEKIEEKTAEILGQMPSGDDEYEKVKYIYEYLVGHTEYVRGAEDNQNICSVFLNGESVCQGYAKAAQYLLCRAGIRSVFVSGKVESGEDHVWNLVRVNGAYYHVDITWGDASYVSGTDSGFDGKTPQINYEYLCVPDSQLLRTHTIDCIVPVPACDSMEANYYVREGAYFTEADMDRVSALFEKAYENGTAYVTLKCADREVYEEMEERLVGQQQVFRYLQTEDGTVAYTTNEEQLHLSFWL